MSTFNPRNGRFATDRYDFQSHVNGTSFNHSADAITLPSVMVDGYAKTNVLDAITAIAAIVPQTLPDATSSIKGVLQLTQDLGGTAAAPQVAGLLGRALSVEAPINTQVLTWDSSTVSWRPKLPFAANGDLTGTNLSQSVVGITGSADTANIHCDFISFDQYLSPNISQQTLSSGDGYAFTIVSQSATNGKGGDLILIGGFKGGSGTTNGSIFLKSASTTMFEAASLPSNRRAISLFYNAPLTATQVPDGSNLLFVGDSGTPPTSAPVSGTLLYSSSGTLRIKQGSGDDFPIGSFPSTFNWKINTNSNYKMFNAAVTSNTSGTSDLYVYTLPANCSSYFEVFIVGHGGGYEFQYKFNMGYGSNSSTPIAVGTLTTVDSRAGGGGTLTTAPTINLSGSNVHITSGYNSGYSISWVALIKVIEIAI